MSNDLMFSPSGFATLAFTGAPHLARRHSRPLRRRAVLVADGGDDYEMNEDVTRAFLRAGDRFVGFMTGAAILGAIWLASSLI